MDAAAARLTGRGAAAALADAAERAILPAGAAVAVGALLAANGGFFPVSWSWASLALLWVGALALLVRAPSRPSRMERTFLAALVALVAWVWISIAWTNDATQSVFEGERSLVLVAAVGAALALAQGRPTRALAGGTLAGITAVCAYALATRLLPGHVGRFDPLAVYRLNAPVGYWNGLGITAAIGVLLAVGLATRSHRTITGALAALTVPALLLTLYFTYSRGSWLALAAGLLVLLVLDGNRLLTVAQLAAFAAAPALLVWLASRSAALTHQNSTLAAAKHDGHRIGLVLVALALLEAAIAIALRRLRTAAVPRALRVAWAVLLSVAVIVAVAAATTRYGSPTRVAHRIYRDFTAPPPKNIVDLNSRVFNLSNNGRIALWRVGWHEARAHVLTGGGAGSYERYYLQHRVTAANVEDAHSLYLETLAELGVIGLALLVTVLAVPLAAAVRFRHHPLVPFAAAAYCAYLVHASIDWDWELAGVTLAAVLCGLACVGAGRSGSPPTLTAWPRGIAAALALGLSALAVVGLLGNTALESSQSAASSGDWREAASHAHSAIRWMPWSAAGWQALGEAQLGLHDRAAARRSLDRAAAKDPGNWVIWLDLVGASKGKEQVAAVNRAYRLDPLDPALVPYVVAAAGS